MPDHEVGDLIWVRVTEILPDGVLVQSAERQGFLPRLELAAELKPGQELLVKVVGQDSQGRLLVSARQVSEAEREEAEFHREMQAFRFIFSERAVPIEEERKEEPVEWRLARWIAQAESVLRQHRTGRLVSRPLEEKE